MNSQTPGQYDPPPTADDPFDLKRFVDAQSHCYERVLEELRRGRKNSHWMWFVFPQIRGLGRSATARKYAISSLDEARAYLAHDVLGPRLLECTKLVNRLEGRTLRQIFGTPDDLKFRSSMTLFAAVAAAAAPAATRAGSQHPRVAKSPDPRAVPTPDRGALQAADTGEFQAALDKYCNGQNDPLTLESLGLDAAS